MRLPRWHPSREAAFRRPRRSADRFGSRETLPGVADQSWIAVNKVIEAALADGALLERPPVTDDDVMWLAATITDHVVAAFVTEPRRN